jgi:hypothetical protein
MINPTDQRPRPAADLLWREVEDGMVLIAPDGRIQALNESGGYIWNLLVAGQTVSEMKWSLLTKYGISEIEAAEDLLTFLDELAGTDMIIWE